MRSAACATLKSLVNLVLFKAYLTWPCIYVHNRDCFFSASNAMHKNEFIHAINGSFGSGGMFCTLTDSELGTYLLKKVMSFMRQDRPHTLRAVRHIGQQECSPPIFVLSPEVSTQLGL